MVTLKFSGKKLDKKDLIGKSDPYFEISRLGEHGRATLVFRSEVKDNTLNPSWKAFSVGVARLCNGDYQRPLGVAVYDSDSDGSFDVIGSFETSLARLSRGAGPENVYECINEKKAKKSSKYKNSGTLVLESVDIVTVPTFLDYIQGDTNKCFTYNENSAQRN